jgi:predicted NBD/HSP70 family sugar kinase
MRLQGTNQEHGRPYNRRIILEAIRRMGPVSKGDIAAEVNLTVQTVANIARELEASGYVTSHKTSPSGRGSPARLLRVKPEGAFSIGVNISPQRLEAGAINLEGDVIDTRQADLKHPEPRSTISTILDMVADLKHDLGGARVLGMGLAMPGPYDVESMSFVGPTTLEGWKGIPVRDNLASGSRLPVFVETDHAAAALGEQLYGEGRGLRNFYYIYFSTGLGGSMMHEGQALRGAHRNAGELGHVPLVENGLQCPCGNSGCLERYLSLEACERRSAEIGFDAWIAEAAPLFRRAIITIENMFDPETIILGGLAERALLEQLCAAAEPLGSSVAGYRGRTLPRLTISAGGPRAVLRGAAALAVSAVLSPRFGLLPGVAGQEPSVDFMLKSGVAA